MGLLVPCWLKGGLCLGFGRLTVLFLLLVGGFLLTRSFLGTVFALEDFFSFRVGYSD